MSPALEVQMAKIAVLGMGLLGSGFAENLLQKGHEVRVWNRTASKCAPLVALGATRADTPADAVRGADRVHLILAEDEAVDAVLAQLTPSVGAGVPVIDHSTNLPTRVAARFETLRARDVRYLHAPVFMAPVNARQASGIMLIAGPTDEVEALLPALQAMTGKVLHVGQAPDHAATLKLAGNGLLIMVSAVMGDLFQLAEHNGLKASDVLTLFENFSPSPVYLGKRVLSAGDNPATFELTMARKDIRLMIEGAGGPAGLQVLPAVAAAMDRSIEAGQGDEDYTIFARRR
jgi:3-hydroxyisobutyrate dehydrogenase